MHKVETFREATGQASLCFPTLHIYLFITYVYICQRGITRTFFITKVIQFRLNCENKRLNRNCHKRGKGQADVD